VVHVTDRNIFGTNDCSSCLSDLNLDLDLVACYLSWRTQDVFEKQNPGELDKQRQNSLHDREATQQERKKIQKRRQEIEQRRNALSRDSDVATLTELLDLQHEIVGLQEHIVELQLDSDQQRELFAGLKKSANGLWYDLSMLSEESQLRLESIQGFAEAIQKLHEQVQKQEEDYQQQRRASKHSAARQH
jgi:hypothetical protein